MPPAKAAGTPQSPSTKSSNGLHPIHDRANRSSDAAERIAPPWYANRTSIPN